MVYFVGTVGESADSGTVDIGWMSGTLALRPLSTATCLTGMFCLSTVRLAFASNDADLLRGSDGRAMGFRCTIGD